MKTKDYRLAALEFAKEVGIKEARKLFVIAGASPSVADKLSRGVYPSEVGTLLGRAIDDAITGKGRAS